MESDKITYHTLKTLYDDKSASGFICSFSHLKRADYRHVYEPSEDSFLLIDALQLDLPYITDTINPSTVVEVGVGSGVVITSLAMLLKRDDVVYVATDINPKAIEAAERTAEANQIKLKTQETTFCDGMGLEGKVDILIFNPPYVVTPKEELEMAQEKKDIEASWAGGENGIEVLMAFLEQAEALLSEKGAFYLLLIEENFGIVKILREHFPKIAYLVKRECPGERQIILRLQK
ncbi:hypothetical protein FGO68_gene10892 [Halteria grandinella]|uniref:Methyltransferase small domain-containing protein n=1 Tax=Halteria grandinella TaxID=5974 RepID=A0A8J8SYP2_HALGN|nr:hypothetical protein FGO68_gene10892 [Halteria grandinella]